MRPAPAWSGGTGEGVRLWFQWTVLPRRSWAGMTILRWAVQRWKEIAGTAKIACVADQSRRVASLPVSSHLAVSEERKLT